MMARRQDFDEEGAKALRVFEGGIRHRHLRPRRSSSRLVSTKGNDVTDDEPIFLLLSFSMLRISQVTFVYPSPTLYLPYRSSPESLSKLLFNLFQSLWLV
ncbi:hypothetical protein BYT27DRAFT_7183297 [Phlegmacium glaucopus]|nr:hypothetical protein BYT27DRAFT_7183297 [Phlegmacium glaucopus]